MRVSRTILRNAGLAVAAAGLVVFFAAVRPRDFSAGGSKTVIQVWHPWGGPMLECYERGVRAFEKARPDVACKLLYVTNDLSNSQKFYTAVVGNCPPDVIFVDGPQVAEWAERGLLLALDDLLREAGRPVEELRGEFFAPCWRQCTYKQKVWAITYCADPNFCFFWNKDLFERAIAEGDIPPGAIDPERPPATLAEMDRWNELITKGEGHRLVRVGLVPWGIYGMANSIFTWGWAFGGEFYDRDRRRITADHPKVVEALAWMCRYARKYDPKRISALQSSFGSGEQNPFIMGRQAMQVYHLSGVDELRQYAPGLRYGIAPLPQPPGGEVASSWVGGWTLAIPATVTDPAKRKAALEYILWTCAGREGTSMDVRTIRNFPGWKVSTFFDQARQDPDLSVFVDILEQCKHQRPVMPAQAQYMLELNEAVEKAVYGDLTPEQALKRATRRTQAALDRVLGRQGARP